MARKSVLAMLVSVVALLVLATAASATHTTVAWKGQVWDVSDNGTALVDGSGNLVLSRTGGSFATVHLNRIMPAPGGNSFVNASGTPWIAVSYIDSGTYKGVDVFIDDEVTAGNPRLQAGSLWGCDGFGYARYGAGIEQVVFAVGCELPPVFSPGTPHTIYVGQRPDGTVDYNFDGVWYPSTFLKDNTGPFDFNDVYLRIREPDGVTAVFTDFRYGSDHPISKDTCKKGNWANYGIFKNQGDCIQYVNTGK